jgi:hypothetical protein
MKMSEVRCQMSGEELMIFDFGWEGVEEIRRSNAEFF